MDDDGPSDEDCKAESTVVRIELGEECTGKSTAWASIDSWRGATIVVPFRDASSNRRRSTDDGASCSSAKVKSRTLGSETLRSLFGGD